MNIEAQLEPADQKFLDVRADANINISCCWVQFIKGKGRGIVTDSVVEEDDELVEVPASSIITVLKTAAQDASKGSGSSVHGLLTLKLLQDDVDGDTMKELLKLWKNLMPPFEVLKQCMPLLWPGRAQQLLPEPAKVLLQRQRTKFQRDWNDFRSKKLSPESIGLAANSGQSAIYEAYAHAWLLINTRSFYWDYPTEASDRSQQTKKKAQKAPSALGADHCMALVPVIDLFNHSYTGESCAVEFNHEGFTVRSDREYGPGEELFVSYGNHGNEFLLVEYGFMMPKNVCDTVSLDQYVIPEFKDAQRTIVEETNLFGNYNLHASDSPSGATPPKYCYRTKCALRVLILPAEKARRYIKTGGDSESEETPDERRKIFDMWQHICGHVFEHVLKNKIAVETDVAKGQPQGILLWRWNQISDMVYETIRD